MGLLRRLTTRQCSLFLNAVYYFKFLTNQNKRVVTQLFYKSDNILKDLSLKVKIPDLRSEISLLLADQDCIYDHKQTKRFSWKDNENKKCKPQVCKIQQCNPYLCFTTSSHQRCRTCQNKHTISLAAIFLTAFSYFQELKLIGILQHILQKQAPYKIEAGELGSRVGVVVRAVASHLSGPGSI